MLALTSVRNGDFSSCLREVICEYKVSTVVLGGSHEKTGIVTRERLHHLSDELSKELSVEFIVVHNGEVIFRTQHAG